MAQSYRVESFQPQVRCVVIADDLTGACDAAAPFCVRGASVRILLDRAGKPDVYGDVLSVSTASRDLPTVEMKRRLFEAAAKLKPLHPAIVFKKIDSTLRGNPGEEIAATLDAFDCEIAVIAPAFPAMGRHVREGFLHSNRDPGWQPVHIETLLRAQGIKDCEHLASNGLPAALARQTRFLSLDANTAEDLEAIVTVTLACSRRVLWAGSAGLASALARALFPEEPKRLPPLRRDAPVLFAIGSDHIVTTEQINQLSRRLAVQHVPADSAVSKAVVTALRSGRHTVLKIGRDTTSCARIADLLGGAEHHSSALLLSGGDTAALVCDALGAQAIALQGEVVTGLPWGVFDSGVFAKLPVVAKSGAFGDPDALIKVAEFFSCVTR